MSLLLIDEPAQASGPNQGVIEEARRRQHRRRVAGVAAIVALGIAAILSASIGDSHPVPPRPARSDPASSAHVSKLGGPGFDVHLSPVMDGGQYGWCVLVTEGAGAAGNGGCSMTPISGSPISYLMSTFSAKSSHESIVAVTTPQVATVIAGKQRLRPLALSGLPYGLRAARILLPVRLSYRFVGGHRRLVRLPPREPTLVALDARGHTIPQRTLKFSSLPRVRASQPPGSSSASPCRLQVSGLVGLSSQWSHVASSISPYPAKIIGRAFFSCVDVEYYQHGWPLDAALLLDAAHPGAPPAAIPDLAPVPGMRGFFNGPGGFKGQVSATRAGNAWLVVAGGKDTAQRITLLRHLTATVRGSVSRASTAAGPRS